MYGYDHHIGYGNASLCFLCVCVCVCARATLMVVFINVCIGEQCAWFLYAYESLRVNEEHRSGKSVHAKGLTNKAVNVS